MVDKTTTGLTAATVPLEGDEIVNITQDGNSRKVTTKDLASSPHTVYLAGFFPGQPLTLQIVAQIVFAKSQQLPINASGSRGFGRVAATGITDFDIQRNGVSIGTMSFAAAAVVTTFTVASATTFSAGDRLSIIAPVTPDATLVDISFNLAMLGV